MYQIQQITVDPFQRRTLVLPDGNQISLTLAFYPMQLGWFVTELTYQTFVLRGLRITVSPNMLFQFKNQIPFGLACFAQQNREPTQQQDFSSGAAKLYLLTQEDVEQFSELLSGQV